MSVISGHAGTAGASLRLFAALAFMSMSFTPAGADDFVTCEKSSGDVAIAACNRAIESGKFRGERLAWAYHNRAVEYEIKESFQLAIADYNAAMRINPGHPGSLVGRGNCHQNLGDFDRAFQDYNQVLSTDPNNPNALFNRGLAYYRRDGKDPRARQDFEKSVSLSPRNNSDRDAQQKARTYVERINAESKK